ncbi:MAG: NUDIX domain-containing protein [Dehalococcoidia bacterium]|nr:NUDIX domain-containing protein [Dehalococcoidia bacterium]
MTDWPEKHVVTCFLECRGHILLLRRSSQVGSFQGRWAGVSGYVESSPDDQSLIEIQEETGLSPDEVTLVRRGCPLMVDDAETHTCWVVHPYLYHTADVCVIKTDWEHSEFRWIEPRELLDFDPVPGLAEAFRGVCEMESAEDQPYLPGSSLR